MEATVNGKRLRFDAAQMIGQGGEAEVFDVTGAMGGAEPCVVKIWKQPNHSDFAGDSNLQDAVRSRLVAYQDKIPAMAATKFPNEVVSPVALAYNRKDELVGYCMRYLRNNEPMRLLAQKGFRSGFGDPNQVVGVLTSLHKAVAAVHDQNVVIGDFNDLNVLFSTSDPKDVSLIDVDPWQFGHWKCPMFTESFVDPVICSKRGSSVVMSSQHDYSTDHYAFEVMAFQSLALTHPYGGVYRPRNPVDSVPQDQRAIMSIPVWHREVIYPKPAKPLRLLPDELMGHFDLVFTRRQRGEFPIHLLRNLRWTTCSACGLEHARGSCPDCQKPSPDAVRERVMQRGKVTARTVKRHNSLSLIVSSADIGGQVQTVEKQNYSLYRGAVKLADSASFLSLPGKLRVRLADNGTYLGKGTAVVFHSQDGAGHKFRCDEYQGTPCYDIANKNLFYMEWGKLMSRRATAEPAPPPHQVGSIIENQTLIWSGPVFGFGFAKVGLINLAFVWDTAVERATINSQVQPPSFQGQLLDSAAFFAGNLVWFFTETNERDATGKAKTTVRCHVYKSNGERLACNESLFHRLPRGACAIGKMLFIPSDEGITRCDITDQNEIIQARLYPDTEPFVSSESSLVMSNGKICVVNAHEILSLEMN